MKNKAIVPSLLLPNSILPILKVNNLNYSSSKNGSDSGFKAVNFSVCPGEVLALFGEKNSGVDDLISCLLGQCQPDDGELHYLNQDSHWVSLYDLSETHRLDMIKQEWAILYKQNAMDWYIGWPEERYCDSQDDSEAQRYFYDTKLPLYNKPGSLKLNAQPSIVVIDNQVTSAAELIQEYGVTSLQSLIREKQWAVIISTCDLRVARILSQRIMIFRNGETVETGLTDQVLEDPQHPYTQEQVRNLL